MHDQLDGKSIAQIAYAIGYKHPQHFTRVFKQNVGVTPLEYKASAGIVRKYRQ